MDDRHLQIAWRLAVGGSGVKFNGRLLSQKNLESFSVPEACTMIEEDLQAPLKRSANLLYGTVLVYRRKCDHQFRETQNVKWSIQRLKEVLGVQMSKPKPITACKPLVMLADDPLFTVDLLDRFDDLSIDALFKEHENQRSAIVNNSISWKQDSDLREMSVSDVSELSGEYAPPHDWQAESHKLEATNIWAHDLDFGFDPNGNTIDLEGNPLETSVGGLIESKETASNPDSDIPEFISKCNDDFDYTLEEAIDTPEVTRRIIRQKRKSTHCKTIEKRKRRIIYDTDIYLSVPQMQQTRDMFEVHSMTKRIEYHSKNHCGTKLSLNPHAFFALIHTDVGSKSPPNEARVSEVEVARRRSSSVSSVEIGRRALDSNGDRTVNSLNLDINLDSSQLLDINDLDFDRNDTANFTHMDISLDKNPGANMETFTLQVQDKLAELGSNKAQFDTLYPTCATTKKQAANHFLMMLNCASKQKLRFSLARSAIGTSQWDVLRPSQVMVSRV